MKKRILSLFLAFAMAATLAPVSSLVKSDSAEAALVPGSAGQPVDSDDYSVSSITCGIPGTVVNDSAGGNLGLKVIKANSGNASFDITITDDTLLGTNGIQSMAISGTNVTPDISSGFAVSAVSGTTNKVRVTIPDVSALTAGVGNDGVVLLQLDGDDSVTASFDGNTKTHHYIPITFNVYDDSTAGARGVSLKSITRRGAGTAAVSMSNQNHFVYNSATATSITSGVSKFAGETGAPVSLPKLTRANDTHLGWIDQGSATFPASVTIADISRAVWEITEDGAQHNMYPLWSSDFSSAVSTVTIQWTNNGEVEGFLGFEPDANAYGWGSFSSAGTISSGKDGLSRAMTAGDPAVTLPRLKRDGWSFRGWRNLVNGQLITTGSFRFTSGPVVLDAEFVRNSYNIRYNHNNGTGAITDRYLSIDGNDDIDDADDLNIYNPGYVFRGWALQKNVTYDATGNMDTTWSNKTGDEFYLIDVGSTVNFDNAFIADLEGLKAGSTASRTINLYAIWDYDTSGVTVNYIHNSTLGSAVPGPTDLGTSAGTGAVRLASASGLNSRTTGFANIATRLDADSVVNPGYELVGWALDPENADAGNIDFAPNATVNATVMKEMLPQGNGASESVDLYAVWSELTYTLRFNRTDGQSISGSMETMTKTYGDLALAPGCNFRLANEYCEGWTYSGNGLGTLLQGAAISTQRERDMLASPAYNPRTKTVDLEPVWSGGDYYIVNFLNEDGSVFIQWGADKGAQDCAVPVQTPRRTGYDFVGWKKANGAEIRGAVTDVTTNISVYPTWQEHTYRINYQSRHDGNPLTPTSYKISDLPLTLPVAEANQMVFRGWSLTKGGEIITELPEDFELSDITLYGNWKANFRAAKFKTGTLNVDYGTSKERVERLLAQDLVIQDNTNESLLYWEAVSSIDWTYEPAFDNVNKMGTEFTVTGKINLNSDVIGNASYVSDAARTVTKKVNFAAKAGDRAYAVDVPDFVKTLPADASYATIQAAILEPRQIVVTDEEGVARTFIVSFDNALGQALQEYRLGYKTITVESDVIRNDLGVIDFPSTMRTAYLDLYIGGKPVAPVDPEPVDPEPEFVAPEPDRSKVDNESGRTWRLRSTKTNAHHITASAAEKDMLVAAGWVVEDSETGIARHYVYAKGYVEYLAKSLAYAAYNAGTEKTEAAYNAIYDEKLADVCEALNIKAVWRYLRANGDHHFTSSLEEMALIDQGSSIKEGIAFFVIDDKENPTYDESENSLIDIIRYNNVVTQIHHFVQANNQAEIDMLAAAPNFEREGIAWEGFTSDVQDMELIEDIDKLIEIIELLDAIVDDVVEEA